MLLFCLLVSKLLAQKPRFYAKTTPFVPSSLVPSTLYFVLCSLFLVLCPLSLVPCPLYLSLFFATNIKGLSLVCRKYRWLPQRKEKKNEIK